MKLSTTTWSPGSTSFAQRLATVHDATVAFSTKESCSGCSACVVRTRPAFAAASLMLSWSAPVKYQASGWLSHASLCFCCSRKTGAGQHPNDPLFSRATPGAWWPKSLLVVDREEHLNLHRRCWTKGVCRRRSRAGTAISSRWLSMHTEPFVKLKSNQNDLSPSHAPLRVVIFTKCY